LKGWFTGPALAAPPASNPIFRTSVLPPGPLCPAGPVDESGAAK